MSSRLLLKSSGVADAVPDFSDLELSELCWNYRDGKLYGKSSDGSTDYIIDITSVSPSDINYQESFDNSDLVSGVLTVTHNLGTKYPGSVAIYDNTDNKIGLPDEIVAVSTTTMTIDLSSFGTITGTWTVSVTM